MPRRTDKPASSGFESKWTRVKHAWLIIGAAVSFVLAVLLFPKKVADAYDARAQSLREMARPAAALWYGSVGNAFDLKARDLVQRLHPTPDICVISSGMADLTRDGWAADMLVEYAVRDRSSDFKCGEPYGESRQLAVFTFRDFSFEYAGTTESWQSTWSAQDSFLFRMQHGTDFPWAYVWFVCDGRLIDADTSINLTDDSEHEYELQTWPYENGAIVWGPPEGVFHMEVTPECKFHKESGLPKGLQRPDKYAVELRWNGSSFENYAFDPERPVIAVSPLSHIYLSGCETTQGFTSSPWFPGAVVPVFGQSPILTCGGNNEDEFAEIRVERAAPSASD